jgi:uncharacterized membrane protein
MKKITQTPFLLATLFVCTFLFSSFSLDYSRVDSRDDDPPVTQKENRRKMRLDKRQTRLQERLKKSKNTVKRQRIQKKIRGIEKQKDDGFGTPAVGIVGMILSIFSFILFVAFIASLIAAIGIGIGFATYALLFSGIGLALAGLIVSIISLALNSKNPDKHTMKGFGIAGMIIGSVMTGIFAVAAVIFFAFMR